MKQDSSPAPALTRGLTLLNQLTVDGQTSLERLAARNQWPKSSVLRFLQALEQAGAVAQDPGSRRWRALKHLEVLDRPLAAPLEAARKRLPLLAQQTGHCAELYGWRNGTLALIDRAEPETEDIIITARIGYERNLKEWDATALTVFSFTTGWPDPEKAWVWKKGKRKKLSPDKRIQRLADVRCRGLAVDSDFNENGIRRFAVPVLENDALVGVLAVAQRQTPRADSETEDIIRTLQPNPSL